MKITRQLNKLPINQGVYLLLPDKENPFFIVPMTSKWAYRKAILLIKPKNYLGNLKKIILAKIPFFLLKRMFFTIKIETDITNEKSGQLILPWNQDRNNKFTIFNFTQEEVTLLKIGFDYAQNLIDNEYRCVSLVSKTSESIVPEIKSYRKYVKYSVLETKFYEGVHPSNMPQDITSFFNKIYEQATKISLESHPYFLSMKKNVVEQLKLKGHSDYINRIIHFSGIYSKEMVPVVIMHGDCSTTNIIESDKKSKIIDWEDGIKEGVPLDLQYFEFRKKTDNGESWTISNAVDFLVVLHYLHFQIKNDNFTFLNKFTWVNDIVSMKN